MSGGKWMRRSDDDAALRILDLRTRHGAAAAGRMVGMKSESVRTLCNRVLNDDLRASVINGIETPEQVLAGYWDGV